MSIFTALELAAEIFLLIGQIFFVCWLMESVIPLFIAILIAVALWVWVTFFDGDLFSLLLFWTQNLLK